jgi:hypothetical protein
MEDGTKEEKGGGKEEEKTGSREAPPNRGGAMPGPGNQKKPGPNDSALAIGPADRARGREKGPQGRGASCPQ